MKRFILPAMLGLVFAACTSDEAADPATTMDENAGDRYMAINIVTNSSSTRAETDYDNGDEDEYAVIDATRSIFYFYDASGEPFTVNGNKNYVTGTKVSTMETEQLGTEGTINTTKLLVVLEAKKGGTPSQVVAVINSSYTEDTDGTVTLSSLKGKTLEDYTITSTDSLQKSHTCFTMSNAVYQNKATGSNVYTTTLMPENFASTATLAAQSSVKIYVERIVGKVNITNENDAVTLNTTGITIYNKDADYLNDVTAKLIGWKLINKTWKGDLLKNIEFTTTPTWNWNDTDNLRSYWANPTPSPMETTTESEDKVTWKDLKATSITANYYPFENISQSIPTKFMFAIQLFKDGQPFTVTRWLSTYYTLDDLKSNIAAYLANSLYKIKDDSFLASIEASDIDFQAYGTTQVEPIIAKDSESVIWKSGPTTNLTDDEVTAILKAVPKAYIWQDGRCVFYSGIRHTLAETEANDNAAVYGVIRNHWYKVTVNQAIGFGSPVFDEGTPIDPTNPGTDDDSWYLDASIHVLAWRLMPYEINLE